MWPDDVWMSGIEGQFTLHAARKSVLGRRE
jgi:hypothetical protein